MSAAVGCWHVTTEQGALFGAAATGKRDAMALVQARCAGEDGGDRPVAAERVGSWPGVEYGSVLCYRGPAGGHT